jgi:hypothetical protein
MSEITFPKLVDSSITTSIVTLENDFSVSKDRISRLNLIIDSKTIACDLDYPNLVNLNYKMKSACNQIEEYIKNLTLK